MIIFGSYPFFFWVWLEYHNINMHIHTHDYIFNDGFRKVHRRHIPEFSFSFLTRIFFNSGKK